MQWVATGFLFVRGRTFIHNLDPRTRLLLAGSIFLVSLVSGIFELLLLITLTLCLVVAAKILRRFGKAMTFALILALITFLLDYLVFPIHPSPLLSATTYALRLVAIIAASSLFFLTTTPDELEQVMRWSHFPTDFVMVFVIAVRFVPVLLLDAIQIMDAQKSRGLEFEKGGIVKRIRNMIPILVPLIATAVNRSLDLAEAMDSRAYGAVKHPTSLYFLRLRLFDYAVISATITLLILGTYAGLFLHLPQ